MSLNNTYSEYRLRDGSSRRLVSWVAIIALISMVLLVGFHGHSPDKADADAACGICDLGHHVSNYHTPPSLPLISVSYSKPVAVVPFFSIFSFRITSTHVRAPPATV